MIMHHFYILSLCALAAISTLYLYRIVKGPYVFDRLVGLNGIATKAIISLITIGAIFDQTEMFIDIAIGYGLLNLVGSLTVARYLEKKEMSQC